MRNAVENGIRLSEILKKKKKEQGLQNGHAPLRPTPIEHRYSTPLTQDMVKDAVAKADALLPHSVLERRGSEKHVVRENGLVREEHFILHRPMLIGAHLPSENQASVQISATDPNPQHPTVLLVDREALKNHSSGVTLYSHTDQKAS